MIGLRQPWQFYNCPWATHTVGQRRALNVIIALALYTWSGYIGCDILSSPLERIHDQTMSIMAYYHLPMNEHMIGQHAIIALVHRTRSDDVGCGNAIIALGMHIRWDDVSHGMPSFPLEGIHNRTTLGVAYYHRPLIAHSIERCRASCSCKAMSCPKSYDRV